jgi:hypothetical protein
VTPRAAVSDAESPRRDAARAPNASRATRTNGTRARASRASARARDDAARTRRRGKKSSSLVGDRIGRGKKSTRGRRHAATGRRGTTAE